MFNKLFKYMQDKKELVESKKGKPVQRVEVPADIGPSGYSISSDNNKREGYVYDKQYKNPMKKRRGRSENYYHILVPLNKKEKEEISKIHQESINNTSFYTLKGVHISKIDNFDKEKFDKNFD